MYTSARRHRRFAFVSTWRIRAARHRCWEFLAAPDQRWSDWWSRLRTIEVDRTDDVMGSRARCTWATPLGFSLVTELRVVDVVPYRRIELDVDGDLSGLGVVSFAGDGAFTRIHITWVVESKLRWMNATAPLLGPAFRLGHWWTMRGGEKGLNTRLARRP